jgi:thiosulfate/3-mercaptopyruvate sulfurtransferase
MRIRRFALALAAVTLAAPAFAQGAAPVLTQGAAPVLPQGAAPLLVDAAWLSQHINDRNLVVLHVDDEAEYQAGHIPGARFITMQRVAVQGPLTLELPAPDDLRTRLQAFGISDDSRIVVYFGKNGAFASATRIILTLDHIGLGGQTSLLNGGVAAWTRAGQVLTPTPPTVTPGRLTARPTKPVVVDAEFVKAVGQKPAHTLVDGRAAVFYSGVSATYGNSGHITGAVNIPFTQIIDSELIVDRARIEGLFRAAGVKPGDTVVAYCHIGQQGTAVVFGARLLGHPVVLYDGSMQDWGTNSRGPVVK